MRHADEDRAAKRGNGRVKGNGRESKGRLVNWTPTEEDKRQLSSGILDPIKALEVLESFLEDGNRLSVGGSLDRGGFFAIIREAGENWRECASISFWGSSVSRCIIMAGYYLREVNPEFPEGLRAAKIADDW